MPENDKNGDGCTVLSGLHLRLFGIDMPFRGCCDEHDLFYEQGGGWRDRWLAARVRDRLGTRGGRMDHVGGRARVRRQPLGDTMSLPEEPARGTQAVA